MFACTFINTVKLAQKSLRGRQVHSLVTKAVVASDAAKNLTSDSRKYHAIARISSSSSEALLPQNECFRGMPIQQVRAASSFATSSSPDLKAFPQYTVFGETCMLTVKVMMPGFRVLKSNTLVVDGNKRGRIVFEWTPRDAEGRPIRDGQIRFALSPEECGLLIDQLPKQQEVDFLRRSRQQFGSSSGFHDDDNDTAEKVLHVTPGQGGMISFKVDFEKDGVGGQHPGAHSPSTSSGDSVVGPLEVIVQTGEYQVIHSLIQSSLPHLVGWTTMMELAMQRSISDSLNNSGAGGGGGGNRGRRPRYSTSEGDLLF